MCVCGGAGCEVPEKHSTVPQLEVFMQVRTVVDSGVLPLQSTNIYKHEEHNMRSVKLSLKGQGLNI